MFQPQPTPFVSSCFAFPFGSPIQPASASPATAPTSSPATINSSSNNSHHQTHNHNHHLEPNPHESIFPPPIPSSLPYGLGPQIPFDYYFNHVSLGVGCGGSGLGSELVGVGSAGAGTGAGSLSGPGSGGRTSRGPTTTASTNKFSNTGHGLLCDGSLSNNSQQFSSNAPVASRQTQTRERQQAQAQAQAHAHSHSQRHPRQQRRPSPLVKMEDQQQDPHGMAAQQAAAQEYQPDLPNYLVGDKTPSDAITQEYAKADQAYVEKTIALPQKYSHYRPIAGDGNCGWRAIGFAYFEKLIETGNPNRFTREVERLAAENPRLGEIGGYDYYEDFAEEFFDTLKDVGSNVGNPPVAHTLLHQKWNDVNTTAGMIYYMRLLAATFLKSESERFDPFIADSGGVRAYCSHSIEGINREIEHLGIVALASVLLVPNDFVLEIAYLDRSPGSQVTTYRVPEEANNQDAANLGPVIRLLYRPDHYDILYRNLPQQQIPTDIQVLRVSHLSDNAGIQSHPMDLGAFSGNSFDALSMIPGLTGVGPPNDAFPLSQQQSSWFGLTTSTPTPPQPQVVTPGPPPNPSMSPPIVMGSRPPPGMGAQPGIMTGASPECTIRFSQVQLEYDGGKMGHPEPFQVTTSTFKNSVWNRAHFGNPDFHPEEWYPEDEAMDGRLGSRRKGSRRE